MAPKRPAQIRPIQISSPIPSSSLSPYSNIPSSDFSARSSPVTRGGGRLGHGAAAGASAGKAGMGMGRMPTGAYDAYEQSPTHGYLEAFDSYPSTPDPSHIPTSPPSAPAFGTEKDGLAAFGANQYDSNRFLAPSSAQASRQMQSTTAKKDYKLYGARRGCVPTDPKKRRWVFWGIPSALVVVAAVVVVAVVVVSKHNQNSTSSTSTSDANASSGSSASGSAASTSSSGAQAGTDNSTDYGVAGSGGDGSTVTTDLNVSFVYKNSFGGIWAQDPSNPYGVSGQAQSWSPSLLETWTWGQDIVRGVNLGGWLVTEPFIVPALYEQYQNTTPQAVDEYTLSLAMGDNLATALEDHYRTFITEEDFALIASAGLNWVRIPLGYWAIETHDGEPYLAKVSWKYFVKAIGWCRKYGLRILLDFHALPGSQNGWNHSGKAGVINWMYGVMGISNGQRHLEQIRSLTEFISQEGIKEVVPMMSLVNEVEASIVGLEVMQAFYYQAYELIRGIAGYGSGNGPIIALHEGFVGIAAWSGFLAGADRVALDQHPYLAFGTQNTNGWDVQAKTACGWGGGTNDSQSSFGIVVGGEWSNAINDCGKWLDGVGSTPQYETVLSNASCTEWEEWMNWSSDTKAGVLSYALSNMDALQNWFFWTWHIGNSTELGYAPSPFWHYRLGWEQGWMPADPRVAGGYCGSVMSVAGDQFNGTFPASATGAVASPTIAADQVSNHSVWPPTSLGPSFTSAQIALFPTFTQTGSPVTLASAAHPADATAVGAGWADTTDTAGAWVSVSGCSYPDEYNATAVSLVPTALCTGGAARRAMPGPTSAPRV